nr:glycosyltransferase family 2 protein [bacterium]
DDKPCSALIEETRRQLMQKYFQLKVGEGYYQHGYHGTSTGTPGRVSIIIPAYNNLELTLQTIQAVQDNTVYQDYELILVDNASADGTREEFQNHPEVIYLRNEQNIGFARANNLAAETATGEFLMLLNNDTIVQPGWLTHLVESLEPDVGIVGARLIYPDQTIQHAGVVFGKGEHTPYHIYSGMPMRHPAVNRRREFNAVTAACMLVRRQLFADVKGFNENYINCYEDIDLCLKAKRTGWRIIYEPRSLVIHLEGKSAGRQDKITHGYLLLMDRWREQLQQDDLAFFAEDGFQIVPQGRGEMLREDSRRLALEWLAEADRLLLEGKLHDVDWILR